jgi:uncharacterized phage protein (TIGR01671 family)
MNREIKFRAWDNKKMWKHAVPILGQAYNGETINVSEHENGVWNEFVNGILMQFTGLYDCEGKEIYEGDIVKILNESPLTKKEYWYPVYQIINEGWSFKIKWINGGKSIDSAEFHIQHWKDTVQIIGNIFENEQLLD